MNKHPQESPKTGPQASAPHLPVWLLAAVVTSVLLLLGIGWSLIM